jgi:DNA repair protein RecO (recombination protein O)
MQWHDEGIILGVRPQGESHALVEVMTREHGRHLGIVRGGRSRRHHSLLQPGNGVDAVWQARLEEHLGQFVLEGMTHRAARLMEGPGGVYGVQHLSFLLRLLPERDPHPGLYEGLALVLDILPDMARAGPLLVRFELEILAELGFGLELSECAATGGSDELVYVSPKTGRAVCRSAGEPYKDRMLRLPAFLTENTSPDMACLADGFRLTSFFLNRHVFEPRGLEVPSAREALERLAQQGPMRSSL